MTVRISIIIPTVNEEANLRRTLMPLQNQNSCEVIIVDGGSIDATISLARGAGFKTITSPRGRSKQMNAGAAAATGEVLLFLHADTLLPDNFPQLIFDILARPKVTAGAFSLSFDDDAKSLYLIAWCANLRSRFFQLPYGDQALFTSRKCFDDIDGFPDMEIMEDFVFIKRLRKLGRIAILPEKVITSARRWQNFGILRTTLINQLIVSGHKLGVRPATLAKWYQRMRGISQYIPEKKV
jgi:rSAM/selenodomain-associated transferase 2